MEHYELGKTKYNMVDKKLEVALITKEENPDMQELLYIDIDADALIADGLSDKCVFFHASCVASERNHLVFAGTSESGKSTMSVYLGKKGFSLLADDVSVLRYDAIEAVPYPTIGNFRARAGFLDNPVDIRKSILRHVYDISDPEFKKIYDLETRLYRPKFTDTGKKKNLNFIFIEGRGNGRPHLKTADKTDSATMRQFFRFITIPEKERKANISKIMDLYTRSYLYYLIMGTPGDTADMLCKKFK